MMTRSVRCASLEPPLRVRVDGVKRLASARRGGRKAQWSTASYKLASNVPNGPERDTPLIQELRAPGRRSRIAGPKRWNSNFPHSSLRARPASSESSSCASGTLVGVGRSGEAAFLMPHYKPR